MSAIQGELSISASFNREEPTDEPPESCNRDQPTAPTFDRRYERAPVLARDAANYIRDVGRFATFLRRSPDTATADDVRRFQVEQRDAGVPTPTMNSIVSALRFFFTHTIDRPDLARELIRAVHPRNLPVVLSPDEVARLLNATTCLKHQAALSVADGAGLRVAEVAALKVTDVDTERMLLRVERGKGGRYRNAMLPADLLTLLREWWKVGHQQGVMHRDGRLFPGQRAMKPISTQQLLRIVVEAAQAAEITKRVGPHTLRHSFAIDRDHRNLTLFTRCGVRIHPWNGSKSDRGRALH